MDGDSMSCRSLSCQLWLEVILVLGRGYCAQQLEGMVGYLQGAAGVPLPQVQFLAPRSDADTCF